MRDATDTTVLAFFEELTAAQAAARELDANGVDRRDITIGAAASIARDAAEGNSAFTGEPPSGSSLVGFFRSLFHNGAAGQPAPIGLIAHLHETRVETAVGVLKGHGAVRIDRRNSPAAEPQEHRPLQRPVAPPSAPEKARDEPPSMPTVDRPPVRVRPRLMERSVEQPVTIRDELIEADRRPADRLATDGDLRNWSNLDQYTPADGGSEPLVIPVIEERLEVEKNRRETARVRVRKTVESEDKVVEDMLVEQAYDVQHVPVNRVIEGPVEPRYEGDTLVLPVVEEVLVVEKRLMLREEVRITRKRQEHRSPQTHTLRREKVQVDRVRTE
jgi:uncharacterized protein (TIGR02271 family)